MFSRIKHLIGRRLSPPPKALPPYDVLVFPVIEWRDRLQRPQQLSREFARRGHRVFYFSAELMPGFCACDTGWEQVEPNIFLVKVPGSLDPPRIYEDVPDAFQLAAMENGLRKMLDRFTLRSALAIVDYPFWAPLARLLAGCVVLYDCMDDYASFGNAGRPALELEAGLARDADLVVCSSTHLQKHIAGFGKESVLVRNGADVEHFAPRRADLTIHSNGSTAGFWGAIAEWTDIELLTCAARALPHVQFVLIGEVMRTDVSELASLPNVEFIGHWRGALRTFARLPALLRCMSLALSAL